MLFLTKIQDNSVENLNFGMTVHNFFKIQP